MYADKDISVEEIEVQLAEDNEMYEGSEDVQYEDIPVKKQFRTYFFNVIFSYYRVFTVLKCGEYHYI